MLLKSILFVLFITLTKNTDSQECQQIVNNWILYPENLPHEVYINSGKFINDLGDYNNCNAHSPNYKYFTLRFINKLVGMQYIGLCAPIDCEEQIQSNQYSPSIEKYLNQLYMNKTNATTGIFFKTTFYNPIENQPKFDWSNYLTLGLFILLITLGVAGSVVPRLTESQNLGVKVLKAFSFYDNFGKIIDMSSKAQNENLLILNGMRVLSIYWIVFGHDLWFRFMNMKNWMETIEILRTPGIATLLPAAYFAVDTFFWIGGFLITIGLIGQMSKAKSFIPFYFGCVLHRFIRIWPTYMIAILFYWKIAPYILSGPIWLSFKIITNSCNNGGILWNMFFLDNFQDHGPSGMDYCFGWGWYLAVDFQLFLITPFIILAYIKNKKLGWIVTFILFLASVICAFVLILVNDWRYPIPNPKMKPQPQFMDQFYYKPYVRASAYFMGIFSGFLYHQWKENDETVLKYVNKIKRNIPIRILFYVIGITLTQLVIWIVIPFQTGGHWSTLTQAFYNSLNRVIFLIGVYLCIFAALFGCRNDPSKFILGHRLFGPLAKVSFCVYLVHLIIVISGTYSSKMDIYWEPYTGAYVVISDIFWSTLFATGLSLMIESPTMGLQKIFLHGGSKKNKDKQKTIKFVEQEQQTIRTSTTNRQSLITETSKSGQNMF